MRRIPWRARRGIQDFWCRPVGRSSTKGNVVGDSFYWAINRSLDATIGAEYLSKRGWSQRGEFRARPSDTSYMDLNYFGVIDRGIAVGTSYAVLRCCAKADRKRG